MKKTLLTLALLITFCSNSFGQELVKDIWPGKKKSDILSIHHVANSTVTFLVTNDSNHGYELWRTLGTSASTIMVKDINPGIGNAFSTFNQVEIASIGNKIIFAANDGVNGTEIWTSSGSAVGTAMLKDIKAGSSGSFPRFFTEYNNEVYFSANGPEGYELWKTDGTTAGTVLVKDIITPFGSEPKDLTVFKGELYFVIKDRNNNSKYELWKTNGTNTGTLRVSDSASNLLSIRSLMASGDNLFFSGTTANEGVELWASDGTKVGTRLVKELTANPNNDPRLMIDFKGKVFFTVYDGILKTIYESDGTAAGTKPMITFPDGIYSAFFKVFKNKFYFVARHNSTKYDIWASDGTNDGTRKVTNLDAIQAHLPNNLFVSNNRLFFRAQNKADGNNAYELYVTDGTQSGTKLTKNINTKPNASAQIWYLTEAGNTIYFAAEDSAHGEELWKLETTSYKSVTASGCDSVAFLDSTYTKTGTYLYYLENYRGYDSAITLNFTVAPVPTITFNNGIFTSSSSFQYQWQKNGTDISGATSQTYTPTENGLYTIKTVSIVSKSSCTKISEPFNLNNLGAQSLIELFEIYPNPTKRMVTIKSKKQILTIDILSISGAHILQSNQNQLDLDNLPDGMYLINILFKDGTYGKSKLLIAK